MNTTQTPDCDTEQSECTNSADKIVRFPDAGMGASRTYCESCLRQLEKWGVEYEEIGEVRP